MTKNVLGEALSAHHRSLRWVVVAAGIALSLGGTFLYWQTIVQTAHAKFAAEANDRVNDIDLRISAYTDVLYSLRGLFDASGTVTRDDFHRFAAALSLGTRYPGLTNLSYSPRVAGSQRQTFERAVRAEASTLVKGLPEFSIKPPGARLEYLVLSYIEPMELNIAAWGLDLLADPKRRNAVERARDTGLLTSVSGITLVRDSTTAMTSTLLRLAVYRGGGVPDSVADRQRLLTGVAGSTLRIGELIEAAWHSNARERMRVQVFAGAGAGVGGDAAAAERVLYDSHPADGATHAVDYSAYTVTQPIAMGDRAWRIAVTPLVNPVSLLDTAIAGSGLGVALGVTALLFMLMNTIDTAQHRSLELAERNREAALLTSLGEDLHSSDTMEAAYGVVANHMPEFHPGAAGMLYVVDKSTSLAKVAVRWGAPGPGADTFALQDCQSIRGGQPHFVAGAAHALDCGHFTGTPPACYVCVPLIAHGEVIGILHARPGPDAVQTSVWGEVRRNLIKAAAQHVALAMANLGLRAKLLDRATHDKLTGLYNRHYMLERFEQELNRARRHGRPIGVVMLDIDHFKRFNDNFGHAAGDLVLRELAGVMQRVTRSSDAACRYGGEEFLLLMPETTREGTEASAEKLRQEVGRLALEYGGRSLGSVTISAGVAVYPEHGANADALLRAADEALYEAKGAGRNRVFVKSIL